MRGMRLTSIPVLLSAIAACAPAPNASSDANASAEETAAAAPATETAPMMDAAALKDAIQAREKEWSAAFLTGDGAAVAALYTEDAASIPAAGEWNRGRDGIAKDMQTQFDSTSYTAREDITDEVIQTGPQYVVEVGHYRAEGKLKKGEKSRVDTGRYMVLWRHDADGTWRILRDIGNDAPAKP